MLLVLKIIERLLSGTFQDLKQSQTTDSTGGSIVSECGPGNGPEWELKTVSLSPIFL